MGAQATDTFSFIPKRKARHDFRHDGLRRVRTADWVEEHLNTKLEVVSRPQRDRAERPTGITVLKRRWVVERTFAWEGRNRRLAKDYEGLPETEEPYLYLGMIKLMLKRLAKA